MSAEVWENVTNEEYHADTSKVGSTMLKTAIKSPSRYKATYITKTIQKKATPSMLLGSLVHCLVLEPQSFSSLYLLEPEGLDKRTTAGKTWVADHGLALATKKAVPFGVYQQAKAISEAVLFEPLVQELLEGSIRERAVIWSEGDIDCKSKLDLFVARPELETDLILDLKTSDDPTPEHWSSGGRFGPIPLYRYDMSMVHYERSMVELNGRHCSTGLIVVGSDEPFDVFVYDISPWLEVGYYWWHRGMDVIRAGREQDIWRRFEQDGIVTLSPTRWDFPQDDSPRNIITQLEPSLN